MMGGVPGNQWFRMVILRWIVRRYRNELIDCLHEIDYGTPIKFWEWRR